ncbi:MAG: hypothetical protein Q9199_007217 [Rusavskia elegans]
MPSLVKNHVVEDPAPQSSSVGVAFDARCWFPGVKMVKVMDGHAIEEQPPTILPRAHRGGCSDSEVSDGTTGGATWENQARSRVQLWVKSGWIGSVGRPAMDRSENGPTQRSARLRAPGAEAQAAGGCVIITLLAAEESRR